MKKLLLILLIFYAFYDFYDDINKKYLKKIREVSKISRSIEDIVNLLTDLGLINKNCYTPDDIDNVFAQEQMNYAKGDGLIVKESLDKLKALNFEQNSQNQQKIPLITHHVYFTTPATNFKLPEYIYQMIKIKITKLNETGNWQHFLWTNDASIFADDIKNLPGVAVKTLSDLDDEKNHRFIDYINHTIPLGKKTRAYFMTVSDITRLLALDKFGGVYFDIDYEVYQPQILTKLMQNFDFIAGRETVNKQSYYGNAFMAAKKQHLVLEEALNKMALYTFFDYPRKLPNYVKYPCDFYQKLYFKSPPLFTVAYFNKNNLKGNNDIILPSWMIYNVDFARFKNGECEQEINGTEFNKANQNLAELQQKFLSDFKNKERVLKDPLNPDSLNLEDANIYYNLDKNQGYPIIGADMFCGSWSRGTQPEKLYRFKIPFAN